MTQSLKILACAGLSAVSILATAGASFARPDSRTMSCDRTQALIERTGAVVLTTGRHTYDRFVARNGYCYHPKEPAITYIKTNDTNQCPVYNCQLPLRPFDD